MSSVNKTSGAPSFVRPLRKGWESTTLSPTVNTLIENALGVSRETNFAYRVRNCCIGHSDGQLHSVGRAQVSHPRHSRHDLPGLSDHNQEGVDEKTGRDRCDRPL